MAGNLIIGSSHALYLSEAVGTFQANWDVATSDVIEIATRSGARRVVRASSMGLLPFNAQQQFTAQDP